MHPILHALVERRLLVCVGPLVTRAAGLPAPPQLLARCCDALGDAHGEREELRRLGAAGEVARALGRAEAALTGARFVQLLRPALDRGDARIPLVALAVATLASELRYICTSNLDSALERALEHRWPAFTSEPDDLCARPACLVKLCGTAAEASSWVLTEHQLAARVRALVRVGRLLRSHTLLIVGYRAGDEVLRRLVLPLRGRVGDPDAPPSLALVPREDITAAAQAFFAEHGVALAPIGGDYDLGAAEWLHALIAAWERHARQRLMLPPAERPWFGHRDNPYPGLAAFTSSGSHRFCGREADVHRAREQLRVRKTARWLLVHGAAGVGKSSFVAAGLTPALLMDAMGPDLPGWHTLRVAPGERPLRALATGLYGVLMRESTRWTEPALHGHLKAGAHALTDLLARELRGGLLIVVDPLDEAIAAADVDEREAFAAVLAHALAHAGPLLLVTAVRSEALGELHRLPHLHERSLGRDPPVCHALAPLTADQLRRAIAEPARRAGLPVAERFISRVLADVDALARAPSAPPAGTLLAMFAATLHECCRRSPYGEPTLAAYEAIGGLERAVGCAAEGVLARVLDDGCEPIARRLILHLVATTAAGRPVRKVITQRAALQLVMLEYPLYETWAQQELASRFLTALGGVEGVGCLLCVSRERVELAHDALLSLWPRLHDWQTHALAPAVSRPAAASGRPASRLGARATALDDAIAAAPPPARPPPAPWPWYQHLALHALVCAIVILVVENLNQLWRAPGPSTPVDREVEADPEVTPAAAPPRSIAL